MSKKKNRKQVEVAINQLRDLFCDILLQDDKKLSTFSKNPELISAKAKEKIDNPMILRAYFEHHLKELYSDFIVGVLKPMTHDDLEFYRKFALNAL
jgi:ribosome biogenesis protein MAK21